MKNPELVETLESVFFRSCYEKYEKASHVSGIVRFFINVDGISVCLEFAGKKMFPIIVPPLEHLRTPETEKPDFKICVWDSDSSSVKMIPPPGKTYDFSLSGELPGFKSKYFKAAYQWCDFSLSVMDMQAGMGIFWVNNLEYLSSRFYTTPLHILFHWILEKHGRLLFYGAAIRIDQEAVLITGKDKPAIAFKILESNLTFSGDEYVVVNMNPKPYVFRLYNPLKLPNEILEKYTAFTENVTKRLDIKAIILADFENHTGDKISQMPLWKAGKIIAFDTATKFPLLTSQVLSLIERLVSDIPCFSIEQECDHQNITDNYKNASPGLISIIIPVYNGAEFIKDAVESIVSQNYPCLEIIIVNDGSIDNIEDIIRQLNTDLIYVKQDNAGPASARNIGIKTASGNYITFLDADDLWPENNLDLLIDEINKNPCVDIVHGYAQLMEKDQDEGNYQPVGNPKASFPYYIGAGIYRKEVFRKVGLFDTSLEFSEDTDWYKRAQDQQINIKRIDAITLIVRRHGRNLTIGKDAFGLKLFHVFKKNIERKRKNYNND